jgi:hypothetical protein
MAQRRRERFSQLNKELRELQGGDPSTEAARYLDWRTGKRAINVRRRPDAKYLQKARNCLVPFGQTRPVANASFSYADYYQVSYTVGSRNLGLNFSLNDNDLGYGGEKDEAKTDPSFYPALIKAGCRYKNATEVTDTSAITLKPYKHKPVRTLSLPFGCKRNEAEGGGGFSVTASNEETRRRELTKTLREANPSQGIVVTVGYEPEVFRTKRSALSPLPANSITLPALP